MHADPTTQCHHPQITTTPHITTPHITSRWIGNAAEDGKMATVFARLKVPGQDGALVDHGVHAFLVPIRDEQHRAVAGVDIKDCGYKVLGVHCVYSIGCALCV